MAERQSKKNKPKTDKGQIKFPMTVLKPIGDFLSGELKRLERRKKELTLEDPFEDTSRVTDNASSDTDASEQFGHQKVTAIKAQVERKLVQIRKALARIKIGKYGICEKCGKMIDTDRLMIMPEAIYCAKCAKEKEG